MKSPVQIGPYSIATELPQLLPSSVPSSSVHHPLVINTINTHSWVVAEQDPVFKEALVASDILLPDGEGIVWAVKHVTGNSIRKIAGYDLFIHLLHNLQETNGTCFFLGGSQATLDRINAKLTIEYPNIKAGFYSPPFKQKFNEEDNSVIHNKIRAHFNAHSSHLTTSPPHHLTTLFVGMTAPKQEKWVFNNKEHIHADIICCIGAVFDFYAGTVKRPPGWMIGLRLEWLGRLAANPKKIWKRVVISGPKFLISVFRLSFRH